MRRPLGLLLLLMAVTPASAPAASGCPFGARCRTVSVPLDRSGATPGTIKLAVARLATRRPTRPPVLALTGGPGQSARDAINGYAYDLGRTTLAERDVIAFDARGTGRSGVLRCPELQRTPVPRDTRATEKCAQRLGDRRRFYTTLDQAQDIEAVRAALGVPRLALFGVSYGTKVALTYARLHPERVDRLVLDSTVAAEGSSALSQEILGAMPRVLGPQRLAALRALNDRLRAAPSRGVAYDRRGHARGTAADPAAVFDVLLAGDFDPALRELISPYVKAAAAGDDAPLWRLVEAAHASDRTPPDPTDLSAGLYAATSCEEIAFPWAPAAPPEERIQRANEAAAAAPNLGPFAAADIPGLDWISLCLRWPVTPGPKPLPPGQPDLPTLILSGEADLRTPLEEARAVKAQIPSARLLPVPGVGHSVAGADPSGCARRAIGRFLRGRGAPSRCPRARSIFGRRIAVPPRDAAALRPAAGVPGRPGRTLQALALTLDDAGVAMAISPSGLSGGGLRGGYARERDGMLLLRNFQYVPGVIVDATPIARGGLTLRIRGAAASAGRLTLTRRGRLTGRLGGRRISARLA
jgi:pimeloyl-ACP methyl ester carboxylesterase